MQAILVGNEFINENTLTALIKEKMDRGQIPAALKIINQIRESHHQEFYQLFYATQFIKNNNFPIAQEIISGMAIGPARRNMEMRLKAKTSKF